MKKLEKNGKKTGLLIQRNIGKSGKTRSKKEKKRKKTGKRKIFFKRERISFRSRSNKFWLAHISSWHPHSVPIAQLAYHYSPLTKSARPEHEQIPKPRPNVPMKSLNGRNMQMKKWSS